jgi:hypothetical protein
MADNPGTAEPVTCAPTYCTLIEPTRVAGWLAAGPATLPPSLLAYISHPAYGPGALRADLDRFTFPVLQPRPTTPGLIRP